MKNESIKTHQAQEGNFDLGVFEKKTTLVNEKDVCDVLGSFIMKLGESEEELRYIAFDLRLSLNQFFILSGKYFKKGTHQNMAGKYSH